MPAFDRSEPAEATQSSAWEPTTLSRRALLAATTIAAGGLALGSSTPSAEAAKKPSLELAVNWHVGQMTMVEKIGQLFVFAAWGAGMTPGYDDALRTFKPGGVIVMGNNIASLDAVGAMTAAIHDTNPALPPLISIDEEGGPVIRLPGDPVAGAVALGQLGDKALRKQSIARAGFLNAYGFDVNFAPVADVAYRPDSIMAGRSFGTDPYTVAEKVGAFVAGSRSVGVLGAAKHFPGHGRTAADSHVTLPVVDLSFTDWLKTDALPFRSAIDAGVEMVMIGHLSYPKWDKAPASLSHVAVSALRSHLDFGGVIVTDDLGMGALGGIGPFDVLDRAIDAGIDLFLYTAPPAPWGDLIDHVAARVADGSVHAKRIEASVRRIVRLKYARFDLLNRIQG